MRRFDRKVPGHHPEGEARIPGIVLPVELHVHQKLNNEAVLLRQLFCAALCSSVQLCAALGSSLKPRKPPE